MPLRRDIGHQNDRHTGKNDATTASSGEELDALIVGAGFSGCKLLYDLRKRGFKAKVVEAGTDLGGIWHWNRYPGARVDSQYPVYALNIPEVYETWDWTEQYPGVEELQRYFAHVESKIHIKKDTYFQTRASTATFDETTDRWDITCSSPQGDFHFIARFFIPCIGFAAKRHIPDWPGLDSFRGEIYHSSFWPENVDVKGKKVAVIGQGATGVQIAQECSKDIGDNGSLTVFVRTPNTAYPMRQALITPEENEKNRAMMGTWLKERLDSVGGFPLSYNGLEHGYAVHSEAEREALFETLWANGGFRPLATGYNDILTDPVSNRHSYDFWARKTRERIHDPVVRDILAPLEPPHPFGAKRPSLEQDYYDQFNKPNVQAVSIKSNPITALEPEGIRLADGTLYPADVIALATGFDAVNGGMKDITITGLGGETLQQHWEDATYTYLGLSVHQMPNFFFTYGAQAPTAFSNGPSCLEPQCDFIVDVMESARKEGWTRINPTRAKEEEWYALVQELSAMTLRHDVDSWYMGTNVPGKRKEALNYSGGLPLYISTIRDVVEKGFDGYELSTNGGESVSKKSMDKRKQALETDRENLEKTSNGVEYIEDIGKGATA